MRMNLRITLLTLMSLTSSTARGASDTFSDNATSTASYCYRNAGVSLGWVSGAVNSLGAMAQLLAGIALYSFILVAWLHIGDRVLWCMRIQFERTATYFQAKLTTPLPHLLQVQQPNEGESVEQRQPGPQQEQNRHEQQHPRQQQQEENQQGDSHIAQEKKCIFCGDPAPISCNGNATQHSFCTDCFNSYCRAGFEAGGIYEKTQTVKEMTSDIGELPCPYFSTGECSCPAIPDSVLFSNMDIHTRLLFKGVLGRIAIKRTDGESLKALELQNQARLTQSPSNFILCAVQEALSLGGRMVCPSCNQQGNKDEGCMHITCQTCPTKWCYCCGWPRGPEQRKCKCDEPSAYLERHEGWKNLNMEGESAGYGALHEFHRRRMIYFLQHVKSAVPANLWKSFCQQHPELLMNTPTLGRCIRWSEVDAENPPLLFFGGTTRLEELKWQQDARTIVASLENRYGNSSECKAWTFWKVVAEARRTTLAIPVA